MSVPYNSNNTYNDIYKGLTKATIKKRKQVQDMNKVILMGRLTKDADIHRATDLTIATFTLAVDRRWKRDGEPQADFPTCKAFGKTAEFLEKFGRKGTKFVVEGRLQTGSYEKQDGTKVYTTDVIVENIEFAESKASAEQTTTPVQTEPKETDDLMPIDDIDIDELPF